MDFEIFSLEDLPHVPDSLLPLPELVTYYKNLDDRVLWLDTEIGDSTLEVSKNILRWNAMDNNYDLEVDKRKPIKLLLFSPGGSLEVCNNLIDIITLSKTPVWGINVGMAMSAAFYIQIACHKRMCTKNSVVLIHKGGAELQGNAGDLIQSVESYKVQLDRMKKNILSKTSITPQLYNKRSKEDWYVFADEQLKLGIVDEIVSDINDLL